MIEHTHHLTQYAIPYGRKLQFFKRPKKKGQSYVSPVPAGEKWFKSKAEALKAKQQYDA